VTSAGRVTLERHHFTCRGCSLSGYLADQLLGCENFLSKRMRRLACLETSDSSFVKSAEKLHEYCGLDVSAEVLRKYCEREGQQMAQWQPHCETVAETFAKAVGEMEFTMDAGKANTLTGWRDLKIAIFAKRPLAEPAPVADWATRTLPEVTARTMMAAIEPIEEFAKRLRPMAAHLGLTDSKQIYSMGDGAEWIWNAADSCFPGGPQGLDVYHGHEHIGDTSKALYGEGTPAAQSSFERGRDLVLTNGWPGVCDYVAEELAKGDTPERRGTLEEMMGYFAKHTNRLAYRQRLAEGRPIGSGMVEGGAKTLGLRLKARGARWRVENLDKMAGQVCLRHSTYWNTYWQSVN
jgi:hypothetical protein